jgi:hypothetical protein
MLPFKSKGRGDPLKSREYTPATKKILAPQSHTTRRIALIVMLSALCIGTNYALLPLPNVNVMDAIVFTTSLFFGVVPGTAVATISWLVYGTLNPLGLSLPILLIVIIGESIYVLAGQLVRRTASGNPKSTDKGLERNIVYGTAGLFSTLIYDLITNAIAGLVAYNSVWIGLLTMNVPIPLGIIHEASNFFFFASVVPILVRVLDKTQATSDGIGR